MDLTSACCSVIFTCLLSAVCSSEFNWFFVFYTVTTHWQHTAIHCNCNTDNTLWWQRWISAVLVLWSEGRGFTDREVSLSKVPSVHTAPGALDWWLLAASPTECVKCSGLISYWTNSSPLSLWAGHKCVKQTPHLCWCSLSVVLTLKSPARGGWRQRRGRGFLEASKAEQRPGPLPVLLLLSRLDILVKPSNNAEFSLGSCFYHLFKGWGKTKLYKLENPSEEGASKRNAVTNEPEVFLLVLKKGCTSCPSEQEETVWIASHLHGNDH